MALIAIILSCVLGAVIGVIQFAFLGAGVGQAVLTYLSVSIALSSVALTLAILRANHADALTEDRELADLEAWQDWQAEEFMEAERKLGAEADAGQEPEKRRSA